MKILIPSCWLLPIQMMSPGMLHLNLRCGLKIRNRRLPRQKILYPNQQGETKLLAEFEGKRIEVPVVSDPTVPRPVSFKLDDARIYEGGL